MRGKQQAPHPGTADWLTWASTRPVMVESDFRLFLQQLPISLRVQLFHGKSFLTWACLALVWLNLLLHSRLRRPTPPLSGAGQYAVIQHQVRSDSSTQQAHPFPSTILHPGLSRKEKACRAYHHARARLLYTQPPCFSADEPL